MKNEEPNHVTKGSIFDELDPAERVVRKVKSDLWRIVVDEIERRALTQAAAARLLKTHQPDVSNLVKGRVSKFSVQQLVMFAARISPKMTMSVKTPRARRPDEEKKTRHSRKEFTHAA
jgi:predicted XRE-type DNA-binding protein